MYTQTDALLPCLTARRQHLKKRQLRNQYHKRQLAEWLGLIQLPRFRYEI